jgi:zinc protease
MDTDFYPDGRLAPCALAEGLFTGRTPGGLRVVVRRDARSPVAVCNVWVRAGSNREPESLRGWSHGIEHMLFKGTHRRGERDFALEVAAAGGSTNAGTGYETTNYHITVPAARLPVAIDILGDALLCSRFEEAALDAERQVLVHENHMYDDIPFGFGVTWRWALELAFDRSPYRHPIGGRDENLLACPRASILGYWRSAYRPQNMVAVVVGDVDPDDAFARLDAAFAAGGNTAPVEADQATAIVAAPPVEPRRDGLRLRLERGDLAKAYAKFAFPAPGEASGLDPVLAVCQRVLNDGRSSRLYRRLQEDLKLVDEFTVMTETGPREGVVLVDLETSTDRLAAAVRECARILGDLSRGPEGGGCSPDELARAARRTARSHLFGLETVQGQAASLGHHALEDDLAGAFAFPARVAAVTTGDVAAYAAEVFRPGNLALVLYVPRDADLAAAGLPADEAGLAALLAGVLPEPAAPMPAPAASPRPAPATGAAAAKRRAAPAEFVSGRLGDGSTFHCRVDRALPVVALAVAVQGGAAGETEADAGLGALAHQALLRGAGPHAAAEYSRLVEDEGASLSPMVDRDFGGLFLTALADRLDPALDRLAEAILEPRFDPAEIEQERRLALQELAAIHDNPLQTAMLRLRARLYGDHPYGRALQGTDASLAAITPDQVVARHRSTWSAGRLQFTASGDLDPDRLREACERLVARLPAAVPAPPPPGPMQPATTAGPDRLVRAQNQAVVLLGWPGPRSEGDDRVPLMLLRQVMGGQSGRLFEQLRNRRSLCYNAGLVSTAGFGQGLVVGYVLTAPATAEDARAALLTELLLVAREPVPADEWERARTELLGSLLIGSQANTARVARAQRDVMYGRDANDLAGLVERIGACAPDDVLAAAARYLRPESAVAVTLGPE